MHRIFLSDDLMGNGKISWHDKKRERVWEIGQVITSYTNKKG